MRKKKVLQYRCTASDGHGRCTSHMNKQASCPDAVLHTHNHRCDDACHHGARCVVVRTKREATIDKAVAALEQAKRYIDDTLDYIQKLRPV